jgi:hypothetical protein
MPTRSLHARSAGAPELGSITRFAQPARHRPVPPPAARPSVAATAAVRMGMRAGRRSMGLHARGAGAPDDNFRMAEVAR